MGMRGGGGRFRLMTPPIKIGGGGTFTFTLIGGGRVKDGGGMLIGISWVGGGGRFTFTNGSCCSGLGVNFGVTTFSGTTGAAAVTGTGSDFVLRLMLIFPLGAEVTVGSNTEELSTCGVNLGGGEVMTPG